MRNIKFILSVLLIFIGCFNVNAQYTITGSVKDTTTINEVDMTSIIIINAKDSVLEGYTRADESGNFTVQLKDKGDYILMANHPIFATYNEKFTVSETQTILEPIPLITKVELMETIIFSSERAIMIKGDTTIYAADSFNVREFATADELLKKLPGLEVSKDGKITAYGKEVQKMYVDGEEFFSDDPSVVAKTLQASSIDKVKVYDDKSETAKNTGIDDGEKVKTINLTLKEDAKKGTMGSLYAGYAPNGYHEYSGKLQNFKGKRKVAVYLNGGNTNSELLGFYERLTTYGGSDDGVIEVDENGRTTITYNETDPVGKDGLPRNLNGGFNYTDKLWKDKWSTNFNGNVADKSIEKMRNGINRYIMPDTQYVNETSNTSIQKMTNYKLNTYQNIELDSMKSLRVRGGYQFRKNNSNSTSYSNYKDIVGTLINESVSENNSESENHNTNISLNYNQKLKKKGRSFNIGVGVTNSTTDGTTFFESTNRLMLLDSNIVFNQRKETENKSLNYNGSVGYTEPLWSDKLTLMLNYNFTRNEQTNNLATYDINNGAPESYNLNFSNDYDFNRTTHTGGFNINYKDKKWRSNVGLSATETQFEQVNRIHQILNRSYSNFNLFPKARLSYQFNTYSSVGFDYNGRTTQPTIDQLQPVVINTDPTNIRIGNDALKQSFTNTLSLNYNTYSVLKNRYSYVSLGYTHNNNPISQAQTLNESGVRVYQYINTKNSQMMYLWGSYHTPIIDNFKLNLSANANYNNNYTVNNNILANNKYYSLSPTLGLSYERDTTLDINVRFKPDYYNSFTSIRQDVKNEFWTYTTSADFTYLLPANIEFSTSINWVVRPQIDNNIKGNNVMLWNASLSKRFLKDRSLKASIYCYDILNQNVGFNYYQSGVSTSESSWNVIKQYFMFGLTWDFNTMKKKKKVSANEDNTTIITE